MKLTEIKAKGGAQRLTLGVVPQPYIVEPRQSENDRKAQDKMARNILLQGSPSYNRLMGQNMNIKQFVEVLGLLPADALQLDGAQRLKLNKIAADNFTPGTRYTISEAVGQLANKLNIEHHRAQMGVNMMIVANVLLYVGGYWYYNSKL